MFLYRRVFHGFGATAMTSRTSFVAPRGAVSLYPLPSSLSTHFPFIPSPFP
jgi:hypothetical protein